MGGLSEVVQVACRAGAVGGGTYVLGTGISALNVNNSPLPRSEDAGSDSIMNSVSVQLTSGDTVCAKVIVGSNETEPDSVKIDGSDKSPSFSLASRSITIVSSTLQSLYPITSEGTPPPAGSVVVFPSGCFSLYNDSEDNNAEVPPVYLIIHSAATGECPSGQSKPTLNYQTLHTTTRMMNKNL